MDWDEGKKEHVQLADFAATAYKDYGATNSATQSYMRFEEQLVRETAEGLVRRVRSLDLGCGEGRISFAMADLFADVVGFDMSNEMVRIADQRRLEGSRGNTRFIVRDLETELLSDIASNSVDFVVASFGMGSFLELPEQLLREMSRVLRPAGKAILSFYNLHSLVHQLPLPDDWQASLGAIVDDRSRHGLLVTFGDQRFDISARAYSVDDVKQLCQGHFRHCSTVTFPSISAVLPQTVSGHPRAIEVCDGIDRALATDSRLNVGAYILATVTKDSGTEPQVGDEQRGYIRVLQVLRDHQLKPHVEEHSPVQTMTDVFTLIAAPRDRTLKSVLCRVEGESMQRYVLCVVAATRRVSFKKVAHELNVRRSRIELASRDEVEAVTGFAVGALSPLGMPSDVPVILDAAAWSSGQGVDIWCGSGKRTESFRLPLRDLARVVGFSVRDISELVESGEMADAR